MQGGCIANLFKREYHIKSEALKVFGIHLHEISGIIDIRASPKNKSLCRAFCRDSFEVPSGIEPLSQVLQTCA